MRKYYLIFLLLLTAAMAAVPRLPAQGALDQIFPGQFGRWNAVGAPIKIKSDEGRAQVFAESGMTDSLANEYSDGTQKVGVILRQFRDPSGAYEAYTAEFGPNMHPSRVGGPSAIDQERLLLLLGNLILEVQPPQNPTTDELQQLAAMVRKHSNQTPLPPIRTYLPSGFSDGTQRYALGPAALRNALNSLKQEEFTSLVSEAGFASGAEAMIAEYRNGKDSAGLLLLEYPTPQLAEQHLRHLEQTLPPAAKRAGTTIERKASLLSLVLKPSSAAYGDSLRRAVIYETEVTWNEPHQTVTDPPLLTTLVKIILGTGLFMVVTVVLGVAFGGVRVLAKIFFPGKVFDRPEQMDVLQLGLSGKRINSRDFY
ncbi:MAG TPA: DUF6599 family protein [Candidatus Limnocylindria bacterium]|jgi:hypothetical protein|nr:DUF6599 family protein [Candidatus Limnocylindria bacterium]